MINFSLLLENRCISLLYWRTHIASILMCKVFLLRNFFANFSASGVEYRALQMTTLIPANSRAHTLRLSIVPLSEGKLEIDGVKMRMIGGCIEEVLIPLRKHHGYTRMVGKDGAIVKQSQQELYGKRILKFIGSDSLDSDAVKSV